MLINDHGVRSAHINGIKVGRTVVVSAFRTVDSEANFAAYSCESRAVCFFRDGQAAAGGGERKIIVNLKSFELTFFIAEKLTDP